MTFVPLTNHNSTEVSPPELHSLKHPEIMRCLQQSAAEADYYQEKGEQNLAVSLRSYTPVNWLREVMDHFIDNDEVDKCPTDWNSNTSIGFAKMHLAAAGQKLNAEFGYDWIGQNFPNFKKEAGTHYRPYPKNYRQKTMFSSSAQQGTTMHSTTPPKNRCFNEGFIAKINQSQIQNEKYKELVRRLGGNRKFRKSPYGRLLEKSIQAVDMRRIHKPCVPLKNQKTGKIDFPNGLQIRKNETTNAEVVTTFGTFIVDRKWDTFADQMILVKLPEEYQYICPETGVLVEYGILDGNHRFRGAEEALETFIAAWLVEMDLKDIPEFANAFCNKKHFTGLAQTDADICDALVSKSTLQGSELNLIVTPVAGNSEELTKVLADYLLHIYDLNLKSAKPVIHLFMLDDRHEYAPDIKPYKAAEIDDWIQKNHGPDSKDPWTHLLAENQRVLLTSDGKIAIFYSDKGTEINDVIAKRARLFADPLHKDREVIIVTVPSHEDSKVMNATTIQPIEEWSREKKVQYNTNMKLIYDLYEYQEKNLISDSHARLPLSTKYDKDWTKLYRTI